MKKSKTTNGRLAATGTRAPGKFEKEKCQKELQKIKKRIDDFQNLLNAERKHALLIVLQGMDASGKDGAIKNVFQEVNPMGCRVISFKIPTEEEISHDFLWRVHKEAPGKGMIHIFNRSHYEEVLVTRVHKVIDDRVAKQRFEHINNFEKLLKENGTEILKFYLHVSRKEQLERLEEREQNPKKMWKYNSHDKKERKLWNEYMAAYEDVFKHCSSSAEWTIVPSDQNWYKEYVIAKKVLETLEGFHMKYPAVKK